MILCSLGVRTCLKNIFTKPLNLCFSVLSLCILNELKVLEQNGQLISSFVFLLVQ